MFSLATKGYSSLPNDGTLSNQEQLGYWGVASTATEGQRVIAVTPSFP